MADRTPYMEADAVMTIRVARPFIYSFQDGNQRRYDPGTHGINAEMAANPWVYEDFADGRISHIDGKPVHAPSQGFVSDHRPENRKAISQNTIVGGNMPPGNVGTLQALANKEHMARTAAFAERLTSAAPKSPEESQGSLNLIKAIE